MLTAASPVGPQRVEVAVGLGLRRVRVMLAEPWLGLVLSSTPPNLHLPASFAVWADSPHSSEN